MDNRLFLEAVFWRVRMGSSWRDPPPAFGNWNSMFRRFRRWAEAGVFKSLFNEMNDVPGLEYALIDGTIVSVHQKAGGAVKGDHDLIQWIKSPENGDSSSSNWAFARGLTTMIVVLVDALGNFVRFLLLPGQMHDMKGVTLLIRGVSFGGMLADKSFDASSFLEELDARCDLGDPAEVEPKAASRP